MRKIVYLILGIFLVLPTLYANAAESVLDASNAYKGIVKIYLFTLDESGMLQKVSSGSGSIIDSSGLVLTNYHVVTETEELDDSVKNVAYQICVTADRDKEPDCSYTARFIASDKDLDVALLKIQKINDLNGLSSFSYLTTAATSINSGDTLKVFGYPGIGGETITISQGVVSGKSSKYNLDWIKTDADMSFGNSGGAGIDNNGKIVGIPTSGRSDMLGSVGYLVDIVSITSWINNNKSKGAVASSLEMRLSDFTKKEKELKATDVFNISYPSIKITKPSTWVFQYYSEASLVVEDEDDEDSGYLSMQIIKYEYPVDVSYIDQAFKANSLNMLPLINIMKSENVSIGGKPGKMISYSYSGQVDKEYIVASGNHMIFLNYNYGKNDKDKTKIDGMINSIVLGDYTPNYQNLTSYTSDKFGFSFDFVGGKWTATKNESLATPLGFVDKKTKSLIGAIGIEKLDAESKELTNNELYELAIQEIDGAKSMLSMMDVKYEIKNAKSYFSIGNVNNAIMIESWLSNKQGVSLKGRDYSIYNGDYKYTITLMLIGNIEFSAYDAEIKQLFDGFKIKDYVAATISEDILSYNNTVDDAGKGIFTDPGLGASIGDGSVDVLTDGLGVSIDSDGVNVSAGDLNVSIGDTVSVEIKVKDETMYKRLKGKIMIKVGDAGKAYYIHPETENMYFLGKPDDAFSVMRSQGKGIKNSDLERIPVGLANLQGKDSDSDGLPDSFEDAIGTDKAKKDSDGDGYDDKQELANGYSPKGKGIKLKLDDEFSNKKKGVIFLQVEAKGEAWYVNPADGKRYFLGRPQDAFSVMRNLGLGISNADFDKMD